MTRTTIVTFIISWIVHSVAAFAPSIKILTEASYILQVSDSGKDVLATQTNLHAAETHDFTENQKDSSFGYEFEPISDSSFSGTTFLNGQDFPSDEELDQLPRGQKGGFKVVRHYEYTSDLNECVPLHEALCLLDPQTYPSLTRARKACRKGSVLVHRGPIGDETGFLHCFTSKKCNRGRVGDEVFPGDIIGIQVMMGTFKKKRCYPLITYSRPRFSLPVLYEDDHMAIVDKPAGISMYGHRKSRSGSTSRRTIRDVLPFCLTPPAKGTPGQALRRPMAVHRLDTPTSGLLVVAKTKMALDSLYRQFEDRTIIKTYTAIVNGIPQNCDRSEPSSDLISHHTDDNHWNVINYPLGGKHAITTWRVLRSGLSLSAKDGTLTFVEVQPRTGRYHQIRRHFAWISRRPLVGDALYAGALQATRFRRNGLYLCSNAITFIHPCFKDMNDHDMTSSVDTGNVHIVELSNTKSLQITVRKELPKRFEKLMKGEDSWARRMQGIQDL